MELVVSGGGGAWNRSKGNRRGVARPGDHLPNLAELRQPEICKKTICYSRPEAVVNDVIMKVGTGCRKMTRWLF